MTAKSHELTNYAFPFNVPTAEGSVWHCPGMTLRDYIATHALSGMLPNDHGGFKDWGWYAEAAYSLADAMLAERDKS